MRNPTLDKQDKNTTEPHKYQREYQPKDWNRGSLRRGSSENWFLELPSQVNLEQEFNRLVETWLSETRRTSSTTEMAMHPSYQQIIGMGSLAIPFIINRMESGGGRWFWALKAITRNDPVPAEKRGETKEMVRIWKEWLQVNGYR
jgi:hypothetical protein